jgi:NAD(P)-dependent dehydrogenase (short-subunit alcohol dehydrogenase family)
MKKSNAILITGVSTGIGYGAAKEFTRRGYRVFGSVRKEADAQKLNAELGENFTALLFDVTDQAAIDQAVVQVTKQLNGDGLCGLINNSGISIAGPLQHLPIEEFKYNFDVNVFGLMRVTQAFLPLLGARLNHTNVPGRILNISSVSGKLSAPFLGAYVGTKHAVEGISQTLRKELLQYGIDVIIIGPGPIETPIWEKGSMDPYKDTDYISSINRFFSIVAGNKAKRMTLEKFSVRLADIFETIAPKTRYTILEGKFVNWVIPRLLPDRFVDQYIKKNMM